MGSLVTCSVCIAGMLHTEEADTSVPCFESSLFWGRGRASFLSFLDVASDVVDAHSLEVCVLVSIAVLLASRIEGTVRAIHDKPHENHSFLVTPSAIVREVEMALHFLASLM